MKIQYIMMQFPVPTQTFAISDLVSLKNKGHDITISALRAPHPKYRNMIRQNSLEDWDISHATWLSYLKLYFLAIIRFRYLAFFISLFFRYLADDMKHAVKSFILLPRMIEILYNIERNPPDIIHCFWGHYPAALLLAVEKFFPNIRRSMFIGAYDLHQYYPLTPIAAKSAHNVFTHAHYNVPYIQQELERHGLEQLDIKVVHRGIPVADFAIDDSKRLLNDDLIASGHQLTTDSELIFVTTSALVAPKNVDKVLKIFAAIHKQYPNAKLEVVGDGVERKNLEALAGKLAITEQVLFHGHVPRSKVYETMQKSDIFLFMSLKESDRLPNVVKEAMLAGSICVVSNSRGIEELIPDRHHGIVVTDIAADICARQVQELLTADHSEITQTRHNARNLVLQDFDVNKKMDVYVDSWKHNPENAPKNTA